MWFDLRVLLMLIMRATEYKVTDKVIFMYIFSVNCPGPCTV